MSRLFALLFFTFITSCTERQEAYYLFFLHNRFLETHEITEAHPQYGKVEYAEILQSFKNEGFNVISEKSANSDSTGSSPLLVKQVSRNFSGSNFPG